MEPTNPTPPNDPPGSAFSGRIVHPQGEGVFYGPGCAPSNLATLLRKHGVRRPMLVTTSSVERCGLADEVASWLAPVADGPVTVFSGSKEHTPSPVVLDAASVAVANEIDGLVSLGGSSVVDLTKGIAMVVAEGEDLERLYLRLEPGAGQRPVLAAPKLPHLALPTTLSGAEFTSAAGITDPPTGEKRIYIDSKLTPLWVLLDPNLTGATPPLLWASTGMKVLSDAVEVFCSPRCNPLAEAAAGGALRLLIESLEPATADADDVDARTRCLFAVGMTLPQLTTVGLGLVAALRHQIGGGAGVPHGIASAIVLPHVLQWNRSVAEESLDQAALAVGLKGASALIERIGSMTRELGLPTRLRDVGVPAESFEAIAAHVLNDPARRTNARPVTMTQQVLEVLEAAW